MYAKRSRGGYSRVPDTSIRTAPDIYEVVIKNELLFFLVCVGETHSAVSTHPCKVWPARVASLAFPTLFFEPPCRSSGNFDILQFNFAG